MMMAQDVRRRLCTTPITLQAHQLYYVLIGSSETVAMKGPSRLTIAPNLASYIVTVEPSGYCRNPVVLCMGDNPFTNQYNNQVIENVPFLLNQKGHGTLRCNATLESPSYYVVTPTVQDLYTFEIIGDFPHTMFLQAVCPDSITLVCPDPLGESSQSEPTYQMTSRLKVYPLLVGTAYYLVLGGTDKARPVGAGTIRLTAHSQVGR